MKIREIILSVVVFLAIIFGILFGYPKYKVWKAEQNGKAQFTEAEQNRRIKIEEAKANLEAEKLMIILEDSNFYDDIFKNKLINIIDQILYPDSYE